MAKSDPRDVLKKDAVANIFKKKIAYAGVFERVGSAFPRILTLQIGQKWPKTGIG